MILRICTANIKCTHFDSLFLCKVYYFLYEFSKVLSSLMENFFLLFFQLFASFDIFYPFTIFAFDLLLLRCSLYVSTFFRLNMLTTADTHMNTSVINLTKKCFVKHILLSFHRFYAIFSNKRSNYPNQGINTTYFF